MAWAMRYRSVYILAPVYNCFSQRFDTADRRVGLISFPVLGEPPNRRFWSKPAPPRSPQELPLKPVSENSLFERGWRF